MRKSCIERVARLLLDAEAVASRNRFGVAVTAGCVRAWLVIGNYEDFTDSGMVAVDPSQVVVAHISTKRLKELSSHSTAINAFSWLRRPPAAIVTGTAGPVAASGGTTALI